MGSVLGWALAFVVVLVLAGWGVLEAARLRDQFRERVCPFCDTFLTNDHGCDWCARHKEDRS